MEGAGDPETGSFGYHQPLVSPVERPPARWGLESAGGITDPLSGGQTVSGSIQLTDPRTAMGDCLTIAVRVFIYRIFQRIRCFHLS